MTDYLPLRPSSLSHEEFIDAYGGIYEHSPWVAEKVWQLHMLFTVDRPASLHFAMKQIVDGAGEEKQLALLCAHPDLAGKLALAGELTAESTAEQMSAGLDLCTEAEFEELQALNKLYREKFGFPFIIAVRGLTRTDIIESFRARVHHDQETEFATALAEVHKIALLRLKNL
tara:strand:- start:460 stop:975 length:516 start_codon:yes stop_codon:yes gene_type:complete